MRAVLAIGFWCRAESPGRDTGRPVLERTHGEAGDLVPGTTGGGPTFCHVLRDAGVALLKLGQDIPIEVGGIAVPSHGIDVLASSIYDILRV